MHTHDELMQDIPDSGIGPRTRLIATLAATIAAGLVHTELTNDAVVEQAVDLARRILERAGES